MITILRSRSGGGHHGACTRGNTDASLYYEWTLDEKPAFFLFYFKSSLIA